MSLPGGEVVSAGLTSGERAVYAAEFVRALEEESDPRRAFMRARVAVEHLRAGRDERIDDRDRAMLEDMLSTGADR